MTVATEISALVLLLVGVFAALWLVVHWTRFLADWLWLLPSAPKLTVCASLIAVVLIAAAIRLVSNVPLGGPLSVAIELALVPFLAVYAANGAAFLRVKYWAKVEPAHAWRNFIFNARREAQRDAYEAPRNEPA